LRYDLATLTRRAKNPRKSVIPLRPVNAPATFASALYRESYAPVIQRWEEAVPKITETYARSLLQLQTDSAADLAVDIGTVERDIAALTLIIRARLGRWAERVEQWHRRRWRGAVLSATSVDLGTLIGPGDMRETLAAVVERNVALVSSISEQARARIADSVFRGLTERKTAEQVGKEIRESVAMTRKRAKNVAADQIVKLSASLNEERRREAGIQSWIWDHSDKKNPRREHEARDGFLYSDDPEQQGGEYEGKKIRKPPDDRPGMLPFCGCSARAVLIL